jgi:hypothetical protein
MRILLFLLMATSFVRAADLRTTIIYDDMATTVEPARQDTSQLWISLPDLKRATGFELKPQGVCRDELCFPLPKARQKEFVSEGKDAGKSKASFNLTAFAQLVHQPVAHDEAAGAWYFGLRSDQRQGLTQLRAPDFTLPDMEGKMHSLSDFHGKKVLLITWASW